METEQWRGQAPAPPQVVVVQQPIIVDQNRRRGCPPYMQRGTELSNGHRLSGHIIIMMITFGSIILYIGCSLFGSLGGVSVAAGLLPLLIGGAIAFTGCRLACIARRQFDALPPDHPDRAKYTRQGVVAVPAVGQTASTYTFPAGTQVVTYPPPNTGFLAAQSPHRPDQAAAYPVPTSTRVTPTASGRVTSSASGRGTPVASGRAAPTSPMYSNPEDPPPSYLEVVKDSRFKYLDNV